MKVLLFLSSGHPRLAVAEAKTLSDRIIRRGKGFLLAEFEEELISRLVLTRVAGEILAETTSLSKLCLPRFKSFAVRCTKLPGGGQVSTPKIEERIGAMIEGKVDLEHPETIVRVFTDGKKFFITRQVYEYSAKRLAPRKVNARPFPHPTSLQPKWARLLINLSGVRKGSILDPLCGAGGILLEAGKMGLQGRGVDKNKKMVEGARENLWFFRVDEKCKVEQADFLEWEDGRFQAVVTDLPYGRSSQLFGEGLEELYAKVFQKMHAFSSKAVIMGAKDLREELSSAGWEVEEAYSFYVHKNLRRWIHVCRS